MPYPVYRLIDGAVHSQAGPGFRWEPLDKTDANALLSRLAGYHVKAGQLMLPTEAGGCAPAILHKIKPDDVTFACDLFCDEMRDHPPEFMVKMRRVLQVFAAPKEVMRDAAE